MKQAIQAGYGFNVVYAKKLIEDVSDEQWAAQPELNGNVIPNHPAWVMGHLAATSNSFGLSLLNVSAVEKDGWGELFGMSSSPSSDASQSPDKATLLAAYEEAHDMVSKAFEDVDDARFALPNPSEALRPIFPTIGEMITFVMTSHESIHLGQLSAWRRAMGLPSVFG